MPHPTLITAGLLLLTCAALAGELYTCKTPDGRTVITNAPCDGRAPDGTVKPAVPKQARQQTINDTVAQIRQRSLPSDYKERVDAAFVRILKDPDSRRIEYGRTHGSAVCGTVNARNAFGGYTGSQVFLGYFDAMENLEHLKIYNESEMKFMDSKMDLMYQDTKLFQDLRYETGIERQLLQQCGLVH